MKKIPVGATISHAYGVAFGEFPKLLKLLWLPLLLTLGLNAIVGPQFTALSQGLRTHDFSKVTMPGPLILLIALAAWTFAFMLMTGSFQYALGQDEARPRAYYLSFAMPLWRLIGAFLALILAMAGLVLVYVIAVLLVLFLFRLGLTAAHISDASLKTILAFDALLAFLAGYCGFIFCWVRLGFLLGAITIAEGRVGLARSWTLSRRNFWRMFLVSLALFVPFLLLEIVAFYALGLFPHFTPGATPAEIQAAQNAASTAAFARMNDYWYLVYPGGAIVSLVLYGLMGGAGSFAYRALTDDVTPSPL